MNLSLVQRVLGKLLIGYAATMLIPLALGIYHQDQTIRPFLLAALITGGIGLIFTLRGRGSEDKMGVRESFVIVAAGWLLASLLGALPFWFSGVVPGYTDALFEAVSGLTTTGSSIIPDVEILPQSILLWRSLTHWLGGMGIIVLFIILLPNTGFGAVHLYNAEVPGPLSKRIMPRIRDTAITLWRIYTFLTLILIVLLKLAGMNWFDAVNHGFSTISAGGFSTKNTSIMYYNSLVLELIIVAFIIIAGGNFRIYLEAWRKKSFKPFRNTEYIVYLLIVFGATLLIAASLGLGHGQSFDYVARHSLFQVVSLITGTGFASSDYDQWPALTKLILFVLMFVGGCAGSTTGGMKISRIMLLTKNTWSMLRRGIHPQAVSNVKLEGKVIDPAALNMVSVFFFLYVGIFGIASIIIAGTGLEPFDAMSAVAASLGNVGPGFGIVGPTTTFTEVTILGKWVLSLCMLMGRLEFFTLLILIRREFWRTRNSW